MTAKLLQFLNLSERHVGVSPGTGIAYAEAARVSLDRHHGPPKEFELLHGEAHAKGIAEWEPASEGLKHQWANEIDTTECGAYALALAGVEAMLGLVAVRRAETGTGADYYLGRPGTKPEDLETCLRLEVLSTRGRSRSWAPRSRAKRTVDKVRVRRTQR